MTIKLPRVIESYFAADKGRSADAVAACFTDTAVVKDEGNTYTGTAEIAGWMAKASTEYSYTVEPFAITEAGGQTIVTSHVVGNFPGSPVDLRYFFTLAGDRIAALEIIL